MIGKSGDATVPGDLLSVIVRALGERRVCRDKRQRRWRGMIASI